MPKAIRSNADWAEALKKPGETWIEFKDLVDYPGCVIIEAMWFGERWPGEYGVWRESWGKAKPGRAANRPR